MWKEAGIRTTIDVIDESDFMRMRKTGNLHATAQWMADFNDPDNFIYTFFGNEHNTLFRSLCYPKEDVMLRIQKQEPYQTEVIIRESIRILNA